MEMNSFSVLQPWMEQILLTIKKDIKTDHLTVDQTFFKTHFGNRPLNKLTQEEIFQVYEKELLAGNQELSEWVVNRWVFKHGDIYRYFAEKLSQINPHFQEITSLTDSQSEQIIPGAIQAFGAVNVYLFSKLNAVAFSEAVFERLRLAALQAAKETKQSDEKKNSQQSIEQMVERHQREVARLQEKYEDKLSGVQRKYTQDVEALKKQIRSLQQQLLVKKS